jgi:hypothetical protein
MNQEISDNNLPIYLQQYKVKILDYMNTETIGGVVSYTTTGIIPSNIQNARVWRLNLTGYLKPNVSQYSIIYDFSNVDYPEKNITFSNIISGTFNLCGRILDASKIIGFRYIYSDSNSTLKIILDTSKLDFILKRESLFSYQLNLNDASPTQLTVTVSGKNPFTYNNNDITYTLTVNVNKCYFSGSGGSSGYSLQIPVKFQQTGTTEKIYESVNQQIADTSLCVLWTDQYWDISKPIELDVVSLQYTSFSASNKSITISWASNGCDD